MGRPRKLIEIDIELAKAIVAQRAQLRLQLAQLPGIAALAKRMGVCRSTLLSAIKGMTYKTGE